FQAQATATAAPAHSLLLGTGVVADSGFTDYLASPAATVTAGAGLFARLDLAEVVTGLWRFGANTLPVGDGTDATITLLAHNADTNKPGLRYSAAAHVWESSNDGVSWVALVQGNDARLSDARTPTAHKASHQHGGSDEVATATPAVNAIPKADAAGKLDSWVSDASTTVKGKVKLATDGESAAGVVVQGNDARLSNARTPTAHKTSHAVGGADALSAADLGLGTVRGTYTRTAAQTIAHATYTYLEWQARGDHAGLTWSAGSNPSQIVLGAGEGGQYLIIVVVSFGADADGVRRASLVLNSTVATSSTMPPHATGGMTTDLPLIWQGALAAGDMMRVQLYHTAGANLDISHPGTSLRAIRLWG
ncbi:MAG: hypothetical protein HUU35_19435, partial [Armatimonadetes bacterium]|nr:hypothetical protein [Armatimonadota bacterium]